MTKLYWKYWFQPDYQSIDKLVQYLDEHLVATGMLMC